MIVKYYSASLDWISSYSLKQDALRERPDFEDLGHEYFVIDVPVSFLYRGGRQTDGFTNLDHYGVKCKYESHWHISLHFLITSRRIHSTQLRLLSNLSYIGWVSLLQTAFICCKDGLVSKW